MTSIQTDTGCYGLWFIWWLVSYNNTIALILLHWNCCKEAREDTEDRLTGVILKKIILRWPGARRCISAWCVKEQSGFICAIQGHLVSAWPSGHWDNLLYLNFPLITERSHFCRLFMQEHHPQNLWLCGEIKNTFLFWITLQSSHETKGCRSWLIGKEKKY